MKKIFVVLLVIILGVVMAGCSGDNPQDDDKDPIKDTPENITKLISGLKLDEATDVSLLASGEVETHEVLAGGYLKLAAKFGEIKGSFKKDGGDVLYEMNDIEALFEASSNDKEDSASIKFNTGVYRKDGNVYEKIFSEGTQPNEPLYTEEFYYDRGQIEIEGLLDGIGIGGVPGIAPTIFSNVNFANFFLDFSDSKITSLITDGKLKLYQVKETSKALLTFDSVAEIVKYGFLDFFGSDVTMTEEGKLSVLLTFDRNKVIQRIEIEVTTKTSTTEFDTNVTATLKMQRVIEYKELGELPFPDFSSYVKPSSGRDGLYQIIGLSCFGLLI